MLSPALPPRTAAQAKFAVAVLGFDCVLTVLGINLAHAPILAHAASMAVLRPAWRWLLALLWLVSLVAVNSGVASRFEALAFATSVVSLCSARRVYLAILTLRANHKPSLALPLLSYCYMRLVGPPAASADLVVTPLPPTAADTPAASVTSPSIATPLGQRAPATHASTAHAPSPHEATSAADVELASLDVPSAALLHRRLAGLRRLRAHVTFHWPRASEIAAALCGALDVPAPLAGLQPSRVTRGRAGALAADANADAGAAAKAHGREEGREEGGGDELGGTGHNVAPALVESLVTSPFYEQQTAPSSAPSAAPPSAPTAPAGGTALPASRPAAEIAAEIADVGRLAANNRGRMRALSRKDVVHFYLSGSEALQAAARLVRVNTGRPLLVTFGGCAHGWTESVPAEGLALGEERCA